jgi:tetratricopeptide (TPR) repeat protein
LKAASDDEKDAQVRALIRGERCLLFIDNLETVDDSRILNFIETLPKPVKALITSRRARVRHSVYPVDVGVFQQNEAIQFLRIQSERRGKDFLLDLPSNRKGAIVAACSFLPLVIEWFVGQVKSIDDSLRFESALSGSTKTGEELLEFCFRRIHDSLSPSAKRILKVMSIFDKPEGLEPIASGAQLPLQAADDALEELRDCALIEYLHDSRVNALTYTMLLLTRKFAYSELVRDSKEESDIRRHLTRYFDATDIADLNQRRLVSEVRLGVRDPESELLHLAIALRDARKYNEAEKYFTEAIRRNATSWRAYREAAEYYRHAPIFNTREALRLYEQAYAYAPKKGRDRGFILREYGILLRDSGLPGSMTRARDLLEEALKDFSDKDDSVCRHALGDVYIKLSARRKAVEVLEPLLKHPYPEQRRKTYPLLEQLYDLLGEQVKLVELRDRRSRDTEAS